MATVLDRFKRTGTGRRLLEHGLATTAYFRARTVPFYLVKGHVRRARLVERYLASTAEPRLHLGAGPVTLPGWLNTDVVAGDIYLDLTRRFPLPDRSFAFVFGEHIIEHVGEKAGEDAIAEMLRILRPGGILRLTTPDLRKVLALYEDRNPAISRADYMDFLESITGKRHDRPAQLLNTFVRMWGHQHIYDEEDLRAKLELAGFAEVARREPGQSPHPMLRELEHHGPPWENDAEAMCLEATRPD